MSGGPDADTFVFAVNSGNDVVTDFSVGDRLDLQGQTYTLGSTSGGETLIQLSGGGTITLTGVPADTFDPSLIG